ncbi:NAD(P)-dependent oxidoreductase [Inhella gelatinilytica]|uniref:NAD(P)-dependent oxidoreductase n=1 Tax=Inhella gelatinilytica TaxID=2795030 RepID=A0A931J0K8_9BURK|nr:NAD(P)-dependent oxidoreductase [Inhella gelatinilytica]MBH9553328.1 NAD(P)-dependent oxidoreductase [Inhella gelatinilytica]
MNIGLLSPGEMGSALAQQLWSRGHAVAWASEGRSAASAARAQAQGLRDCGSLAQLCAQVDTLLVVAPPHAALDIATRVADCGFKGLYIEANAIAPDTLAEIVRCLQPGGARVLDAALVGPPPKAGQAAPTQLLLAGPDAAALAPLLETPVLLPTVLGAEPGAASTLKLLHSALNKLPLALELWAWALAGRAGLSPELQALLADRPAAASALSDPARRQRLAAKAWRFAGEMTELAQLAQALGEDPQPAQGGARAFEQWVAAAARQQSEGASA